jgi:CheY-like chemotaxis protein
LFVAQLHSAESSKERLRVIERVDAAVATMNELFNALLDISKLDAGALAPQKSDFSVVQLLRRLETTFAGSAREKGLSFRVCPSDAWLHTDFILLERILINLVANAVRYTSSGGVLIGCRRRGNALRIEVWDTGPGIPPDHRQKIFGEFYRIGETGHGAGLGLGLAIVDRLCRLLDLSLDLRSTVGKGSRFAVTVPCAKAKGGEVAEALAVPRFSADRVGGKLIVVVDDDPLVRDGMRGLLQNWNCEVFTAACDDAAIDRFIEEGRIPDLIISDYQLPGGQTGFQIIEKLRTAFDSNIAAFVISGDIAPEPLREARERGLHLLHKPVAPMTLRSMLNRMLRPERVPAPAESLEGSK